MKPRELSPFSRAGRGRRSPLEEALPFATGQVHVPPVRAGDVAVVAVQAHPQRARHRARRTQGNNSIEKRLDFKLEKMTLALA